MSRTKKKSVPGALASLNKFLKDADPEEAAEAAEAVEALVEAVEEAAQPEETNDKEPQEETRMDEGYEKICALLEDVSKKMDSYGEEIEALKALCTKDEEDPLNLLEKELLGDNDDTDSEEDVSVAPEVISSENEETNDASENNEELIECIRAMKPIIAEIADASKRKVMTDSLSKMVRGKKNIGSNGYAAILNARNQGARQVFQDSRNTKTALEKRAEAMQNAANARLNRRNEEN